jgi:type I restriction enzyme M protein
MLLHRREELARPGNVPPALDIVLRPHRVDIHVVGGVAFAVGGLVLSHASEAATRDLWVYDFRTNQHFTLKTKTLNRSDLDDFVAAYKPGATHERKESERFKRWNYEELEARPGFNLDVWADVQDESLEDAANLPAPEVIAEEIVESLSAALDQFSAVAADLSGTGKNGDADGEPDAVSELLPDEEHRI